MFLFLIKTTHLLLPIILFASLLTSDSNNSLYSLSSCTDSSMSVTVGLHSLTLDYSNTTKLSVSYSSEPSPINLQTCSSSSKNVPTLLWTSIALSIAIFFAFLMDECIVYYDKVPEKRILSGTLVLQIILLLIAYVMTGISYESLNKCKSSIANSFQCSAEQNKRYKTNQNKNKSDFVIH